MAKTYEYFKNKTLEAKYQSGVLASRRSVITLVTVVHVRSSAEVEQVFPWHGRFAAETLFAHFTVDPADLIPAGDRANLPS